MNRTEYLILRKTPWRESSLIVAGISPVYGRIDFMIRGERSSGPKKYPLAGLFRVLNVEFLGEPGGELIPMGTHELAENYDGIAANTEGYLAACELAGDLLANAKPLLECPGTYAAARRFLAEMSKGKITEPYLSAVYLTMLSEGGELSLPEGRAGAFVNRVLTAVAEGLPFPEAPESYWAKFAEWRKFVCRKLRRRGG